MLLAMAMFARQTGSFVIAEGIEDAETLDFLNHAHDIGLPTGRLIQGGQGFGLGLPAPAATSAHESLLVPFGPRGDGTAELTAVTPPATRG